MKPSSSSLLTVIAAVASTLSLSGQTITVPTLTVSSIVHASTVTDTYDIIASGNGILGSAVLPSVTIGPGTYTNLTFTLQAPAGQQFQFAQAYGLNPGFLLNYLLTDGGTPALTPATTVDLAYHARTGNYPSGYVTGYDMVSGGAFYLDAGANTAPDTWAFDAITFTMTFSALNYAATTTLNPTANSSIRGSVHYSGASDPAPTGGFVTLVAATVPEPGTTALLLGLAGLGFAGWRRRSRA